MNEETNKTETASEVKLETQVIASEHTEGSLANGAVADIRKLPKQEPRVESGIIQFEDDWSGIFLRGDDALAFAITLKQALDNKKNWVVETQLNALTELLMSCRQR